MRNSPTAVSRSENMRRIRSKDTAPELRVRSLLHRNGLRYVLHDRRLPGTPDIVLPRFRAAIQIRGCFWHMHNCIDGHFPKTRTAYWGPKLLGNVHRDKKNDKALKRLGWRLIVIWECHCIGDDRMQNLVSRLGCFLGRDLRLL